MGLERKNGADGPQARPNLEFKAPLEPKRPPEGYAEVATFLAQAFEANKEYQAAVLKGEFDGKAVETRFQARMESHRAGVILSSSIPDLYDYAISEKSPEFFETNVTRQLEQNRIVQSGETYFLLTGEKISPLDPEFSKKFGKLIEDPLLLSYQEKKKTEQLTVAENLVKKYGLQKKERSEVRRIILDFRREEDGREFLEKALQDKQFIEAFLKQTKKEKDPEKAFTQALEESSPQLKKQYRRYLQIWQSEHVADVFAPVTHKKKTSLNPSQKKEVQKILNNDKRIVCNLGENNRGKVTFGDVRRDIAFYAIDGKPKLFIYDRNADTGVRGPLEATKMIETLQEVMLDSYFSEKFRTLVSRDSSEDPTDIADKDFKKILDTIFPEYNGSQQKDLDKRQKTILENLALLFCTPDPMYPTMEDKVRFLKQLADNPNKQLLLRTQLLQKKVKPGEKPEFPISNF